MNEEEVRCGSRRTITWDLTIDVAAQPLSSGDVWVMRRDPDGTVTRVPEDEVTITDPAPGESRVVVDVRFADNLVDSGDIGLVVYRLDVDVAASVPEAEDEVRFAVYPAAALRSEVA